MHYQGKELEAMSFAVNYHQWIVDEFAPYLGDQVAEVGAGIGDVSRLLLQKPVKHLWAFEPSSNLFPQLESGLEDQQRFTAVNGFFKHTHVAEPLDSVIYINVLEHIENDQQELINAALALKPGGYLLIFVPALSWLFSDADRSVGHFRRYHRKPLSGLVEKAGFIVEKNRYFDIAGILPWYVNFVLLKNPVSKGSVTLYDRLVVPLMRPVEKIIRPPLGKNLLLIARKD